MGDFVKATSSSLAALNEQYRAISHNLANANTPGYKRCHTSFLQVLDAAMGSPPAAAADPAEKVVSTSALDLTQGALTQTGRPLDLALGEKGFFVINTTTGPPLCTRNGRFHLNAQGQLVDAMGRLVAGEGGPITIPPTVSPTQVSVSREGVVRAAGQEIGRLRIVDFADPSQLVSAGDCCYLTPPEAGQQTPEKISVQQGAVESSNVSVVEELIGLIGVTRLYEANLKSIHMQDERMKNLLSVAMS